ncbi:MAG: hypothetical protein A2Y62_15120 [Candidatus Fischerbacteria bacterium RBG_13_37_8]|uniref:FHA domain-containing protein n=1 Tax=Candidatus Fischerbacteria bacterium RBG_13_37_8 TaxID=1817863 RepID=A0A1F5VNF9_9BACT|nr:MAG: hypothetical protein A2Y62_15120 [Candidatus Fischerbacteria bacterium RBG_13_37_8]
MSTAKLILLGSKKVIDKSQVRTWFLDENHLYKAGRKNAESVDIDLSFDNAISRHHAEIWFENGSWLIKDTSAFGTRINGLEIPKDTAYRLHYYHALVLGNRTTLLFVPSDSPGIAWNNFFIEVTGSKFFSYALYYSKLPVIEKVKIINCRDSMSEPLTLCLRSLNYFRSIKEIEALPAYHSTEFTPEITVNTFSLEKQINRTKSTLEILINNNLIHMQDITMLAWNECSLVENPYNQTALATFVLPMHPSAAMAVKDSFPEKTGNHQIANAKKCMKELYKYFNETWKIRYLPPVAESRIQTLRLPEQVLLDWEHKEGQGTCLDLVLLFAACLEHAKFQPLLFMVRVSSHLYHAMIACWKDNHVRFKVLHKDIEPLLDEIIILDPITFTQQSPDSEKKNNKLSFDQSCAEAMQCLKQGKFLFALDIAAARKCDIVPLPYRGHALLSEFIKEVDAAAKQLAEETGNITGYKVYMPVHMLLALLMKEDGITRLLFKESGFDIEECISIIKSGIETIKHGNIVKELMPSQHYEELFYAALKYAQSENSLFVLEEHMLLALLKCESRSIDKVLQAIKGKRELLLEKLASLIPSLALRGREHLSTFCYEITSGLQ